MKKQVWDEALRARVPSLCFPLFRAYFQAGSPHMIAKTASCSRLTSNQLATSVEKELLSLNSSSKHPGLATFLLSDLISRPSQNTSWDSDWLGLSHVPTPDLGSGSARLEPRGLRMEASWLPKAELRCCYQKPGQVEATGDNYRC